MQTKINKSSWLAGWDNVRSLTHLGLLIFSLLGCGLAYLYEPGSKLNDVVALGTGYVSLILLVATLAIGPLNLVLKRRNGVNVNLRRDVGIWCGISGIVHSLISFTLYNNGNILLYFFDKQSNGSYSPQLNLSGLSNLTGLLAMLVMLGLLLTSNNLSLRWLKGKSWKFVQRFNYPLSILVLVHTIGYLILNGRETFFTFLLAALVFFVVEAQLVGVGLTMWRERQRQNGTRRERVQAGPTVIAVTSAGDLQQNQLARRRFLILTGITLLTGVSSIVTLGAAVANQSKTSLVGAGSPPVGSTNGNTSSNSSSDSNSNGNTNSSPNQNTSAATAIANSAILTSLSKLAVGACTTFTTPDTGDTAFLIHEKDESVKAFSNICTHRPYELTYEQNNGQASFYCALHDANFDVNSGAVINGPPRIGLSSFKVQVDNQGNVVYG